jgi:serine/threonine protein kinase
VTLEGIDVHNIVKTIKTILANQHQIGEGADAVVVIEKNEIRHLPPEICYKIAKAEITPRGRNSMDVEAELQSIAYDALNSPSSRIHVPQPFYQTDFGSIKLIAMEKLPAKTVDDILRGLGAVPEWLDIDEFCADLEAALDVLHAARVFHRDLHIGNVMLSQATEPPTSGPHGYIIDFGLSCLANEDFDPYYDEKSDRVFTYNNDYDIITKVKLALKSARDLESVRGK